MVEFVVNEHLTKNNELIRFLRNTKTQISRTDVKPYKHFIPTWPQNYRSIDNLMKTTVEELKNDSDKQKLGINILGPFLFGRERGHISKYTGEELNRHIKADGRFVLWATGPPEMKKVLRNEFIKGSPYDNRNNLQRMIEFIDNSPYSIFSENKENRSKVPPLTILNQRIAVVDTEWRNMPVYDDLFAVGMFTNDLKFGNYIFMSDKSPVENIKLQTPLGKFNFQIIDELGEGKKVKERFSEYLHNFDPLLLVAHNVGFDFNSMHRKADGFFPGLQYYYNGKWKSSPPKNVHTGFFPMIRTDGHHVSDLAPMFQKRAWTKNNKLDSVTNFLLSMYFDTESTDFSSIMKDFASYDDLEAAAQSDDVEKRLQWMKYLCLDCVKPYLGFGANKLFQPQTFLYSKGLRGRHA